jgi:hypothetical protein
METTYGGDRGGEIHCMLVGSMALKFAECQGDHACANEAAMLVKAGAEIDCGI